MYDATRDVAGQAQPLQKPEPSNSSFSNVAVIAFRQLKQELRAGGGLSIPVAARLHGARIGGCSRDIAIVVGGSTRFRACPVERNRATNAAPTSRSASIASATMR